MTELPTKRFTIVNEAFLCDHCGAEVPPTSGTAPRDHCPFCLWSRHVDIFPGDRKNPCCGALSPIGITTHSKKSYVIEYECVVCHARTRAKAIMKDANAIDDFDRILELSTHPHMA